MPSDPSPCVASSCSLLSASFTSAPISPSVLTLLLCLDVSSVSCLQVCSCLCLCVCVCCVWGALCPCVSPGLLSTGLPVSLFPLLSVCPMSLCPCLFLNSLLRPSRTPSMSLCVYLCFSLCTSSGCCSSPSFSGHSEPLLGGSSLGGSFDYLRCYHLLITIFITTSK